MQNNIGRAKFWRFSLAMLYIALCSVLFICVCAMPEAMIDVKSGVVFNSTSVILAALLVGHWCYGGKVWAMQLLPVSENEYFARKAKARRSCLLMGTAVTATVVVCVFVSAINSGVENFLNDFRWWAVPGVIFIGISFFLCAPFWRVFWLKRLGKVEPENATEVGDGK